MQAPRRIHFVGSIGLSDTEAVSRTLPEKVGDRALAYPDGETGARTNWFEWRDAIFDAYSGFEKTDGGRLPFQSVFKLSDGALNAPIQFDSIGYAEEALESWAYFSDLQRRGVIPESVRFQVPLPTPLAVMSNGTSRSR